MKCRVVTLVCDWVEQRDRLHVVPFKIEFRRSRNIPLFAFYFHVNIAGWLIFHHTNNARNDTPRAVFTAVTYSILNKKRILPALDW